MKRWKRGDPIESSRLNQQIEALGLEARRGVPVSQITMVSDAIGMQAVNAMRLPQQMFIAAEDFNLPTSPTDIYATYDNIPSGRCYRVRLAPVEYGEEIVAGQDVSTIQEAERVYDPFGEIRGVSTITKGDVFLAFFNPDTNRLEVNMTDFGMVYCRLLTDLPAAEDFMTNPSIGLAMVYRKNGDDLKATNLTIPVWNRIKSQSFDAGWEGILAFFSREWAPINGECGGNSSSSGSVEESIEECLRPGACDPQPIDLGSRLDLIGLD